MIINETIHFVSYEKAVGIVESCEKHGDGWTYVINEGRPGLYRIEAYDEDGEFVGCL